MDLQISNLALHHLIEENQVLLNGFINKVQTTDQGLLKLKVHTKEGDKTVIANQKAVFISTTTIPAKQNPGGFSAFLKKYIFNQRIVSLKQVGFDRIVVMEFPEVSLIFELFSKGNIVLVDKDLKILRAMKKEKWKDRELKKDEIYKFPSSRGKNPLEISSKEFFETISQSKKTIFGSIIDALNVAPGILDFIFENNNWDKTTDASEINKERIEEILKNIKKVYSKKEEGAFILDNTIYSIDIGQPKDFDNITQLLNKKVFVIENKVEKKETKKNIIRKENYEEQIKKAELDEIEFQKMGEEIYLRYNDLTQLIQEIKNLKNKKLSNKEIENKLKLVNSKIKEVNLEKNQLIIEI